MADPIQDRDDFEAVYNGAKALDAKAVSQNATLGALRNKTIRDAEGAAKAAALAELSTQIDAFEQTDLGMTPDGAAAIAELRALVQSKQ